MISPSYNTITLALRKDVHNESTGVTKSTFTHAIQPRPLNLIASIPYIGAVVGTYRGLTGLVDLIAGIATLIFSDYKKGMELIVTGGKNILRAGVEVAHIAIPLYLGIPLISTTTTALGLVTIVATLIYDLMVEEFKEGDEVIEEKYNSVLYYGTKPAYGYNTANTDFFAINGLELETIGEKL